MVSFSVFVASHQHSLSIHQSLSNRWLSSIAIMWTLLVGLRLENLAFDGVTNSPIHLAADDLVK